MAYIVVFENTDKTSAYKGARTWTSYESENAFKKDYIANKVEKVIEQGITPGEAINLCYAAKPNLEAIAEEEATGPDGEFYPEIAELNLKTNKLADFFMLEEQRKKAKDN